MTPTPELYGIGAVALALIGLVWKIWTDSSKRTERLLEVMEKAALSQDKLARNIEENTKVTHDQGEIIKRQTDTVLQMMSRIIKNNHKNGIIL